MEEIVRMLSEDLEYITHEIQKDKIVIWVKSRNQGTKCPYCGKMSERVHSHYMRKLQDLPIQGKKVKLLIKRRKLFCDNDKCGNRTFVEKFNFFDGKATKTNRLQEEILRVSITQSSIAASKYLKASVADVGKSTICNLLKKGLGKQC